MTVFLPRIAEKSTVRGRAKEVKRSHEAGVLYRCVRLHPGVEGSGGVCAFRRVRSWIGCVNWRSSSLIILSAVPEVHQLIFFICVLCVFVLVLTD